MDNVLVVYPIYVWEAATFFVFIVLSIIRILRLPFEAVFHIGKRISPINQKIIVMKSTANFEKFDDSRRAFLKTGAVALSAYSFVGATKGLIDRNDYDIIERTVRIQNLPDEFKGFTIGLMSDIHSSVFMTKPEMDDYVAALNNLKTDIIFVPGDFVNSQTDEVYPFVEAFSSLRAPYGVYGCLGNHDYYADVDVVAKEVDGCGIKLLRNDAVKILKGNSFINLVGVDDIPINGKPDPYLERALSSVQNPNPRILLCHKPYYLETFASRNIDLTIVRTYPRRADCVCEGGKLDRVPCCSLFKICLGIIRIRKFTNVRHTRHWNCRRPIPDQLPPRNHKNYTAIMIPPGDGGS